MLFAFLFYPVCNFGKFVNFWSKECFSVTFVFQNLDVSRRDRKTTKKTDPSYPIKNEVATAMVGLMSLLLITYTFHCTWVTSEAYSSPSIVLSAKQHDGSRVIFDDFREAYFWLRQNTPEVSVHFWCMRFLGLPLWHNLFLSPNRSHLPLMVDIYFAYDMSKVPPSDDRLKGGAFSPLISDITLQILLSYCHTLLTAEPERS